MVQTEHNHEGCSPEALIDLHLGEYRYSILRVNKNLRLLIYFMKEIEENDLGA